MDRITMLVTVKAYPAISSKHGESVCVAGLRTDTSQPEWARLFPVPFRDLKEELQFEKYEVIDVEVQRPRSDSRPESWAPNVDSIQRVDKITSDKGTWARRWQFVAPVMLESMCELQRRQAEQGTSLGAFRPGEVLDLEVDDAASWSTAQEGQLDQPSLFLPDKTRLARIPHRFRYRYRCDDDGCNGHRQSIVDWELGALWRNVSRQQDDEEALRLVRQRWLDEMCGPEKDTVFFAGNQHQHPGSFLVLGVFWPKKVEPDSQQSLFS
jgi:hypothetical protein